MGTGTKGAGQGGTTGKASELGDRHGGWPSENTTKEMRAAYDPVSP